jgi:RAB protein geranylgeranyltransferase component A
MKAYNVSMRDLNNDLREKYFTYAENKLRILCETHFYTFLTLFEINEHIKCYA